MEFHTRQLENANAHAYYRESHPGLCKLYMEDKYILTSTFGLPTKTSRFLSGDGAIAVLLPIDKNKLLHRLLDKYLLIPWSS